VVKHIKLLVLFAVLAFLYTFLTLITPSDAAVLLKYGLTETEAKLLTLTLILPYVAIWATAFYGYAHLKDYADTIRDSVDGASLHKIAQGLKYIALSLPLMAVLSALSTFISHKWPETTAATVILTNYVDVALSLLAFNLIYRGAAGLMRLVKKNSAYNGLVFTLLYGALMAGFVYITLSNPSRQFPGAAGNRAAYYMTDALLIITVIIPYIVAWWWGLRAAYFINVFKRQTNGRIYQQALAQLSAGLACVIIARIVMRLIISTSAFFDNLTLRLILLILYLLLFIISVGFILIALGAKRLKKIEEA
jgi:hypothetical protein